MTEPDPRQPQGRTLYENENEDERDKQEEMDTAVSKKKDRGEFLEEAMHSVGTERQWANSCRIWNPHLRADATAKRGKVSWLKMTGMIG